MNRSLGIERIWPSSRPSLHTSIRLCSSPSTRLPDGGLSVCLCLTRAASTAFLGLSLPSSRSACSVSCCHLYLSVTLQ